MAIDDRTRLLVPRILRLTLIAAILGAAYGYGTSMDAPDHGFNALLRGIFSGALIGVVANALDAFVLQAPGAPLTRAPFLLNVGVKSLVYLAVFLLCIAAGQLLIPNPGSAPGVDISREDILFCFAALFVVNFLFEVNSLLGQNVLLAFATGRYHRPRVEQRIFLMIDMKQSTAAAERLGEVGFHRLLNRFVGDLTGPVVLQGGEIHKYVGDEIIVTWPLADGLKDARCLRACFNAKDRLVRLGPAYEREFGRAVEFRAGLHCGPVVVGEMGTVKKEIALLGDTLNTAARLVDACRDGDKSVIVSAVLLDQLTMPSGMTAQPLGPILLRGKESAVELFSIEAASAR